MPIYCLEIAVDREHRAYATALVYFLLKFYPKSAILTGIKESKVSSTPEIAGLPNLPTLK